MAQLETLKARIFHAEMRGAALEAELSDVATRLARSDAALISRRAEREAMAQELSAAHEELKTVKATLAQRVADVARAHETVGRGQSPQDVLRRELETTKAQTKDLEQQLRVFEDWVIRLTQERKRNEAGLGSSALRLTEDDTTTRDSLAATQARLAEVAAALTGREAELAAVRGELQEERAALKSLSDRYHKLAATFSETKAKLSSLGNRVTAEKQANAGMKQRLKEATAHLEGMRHKVAALGLNISQLEKSKTWSAVRVILKTEAGIRRSYHRLGKAIRKEPGQDVVHAELIAQSQYFDAVWYRRRYLGGTETALEAALHYLRIGASQGHDPGPRFSSSYYLEHHADVAEAGFNPLLHYIRFGAGEARSIAASETLQADDTHPELQPSRAHVGPAASSAVSVPPTPREPSRTGFEAPLPALVPPRYPLERSPTEAPERAPESVPESAVPLRLSGVALGWLRRLTDAAPLEAVTAFSALSGVDPTHALRFDERSPPASGSPPLVAYQSVPAGVVLALGTGAGCEFADIWFINDCDLRARLRATPDRPHTSRVLRCYQYDPTGEQGLALLGEWRVPRGDLGLIDITTHNPYCPLLFVLGTQGGEILSLSLLPFPSLCRGGTHYGELLAIAADEAYLEALRSISQMLLQKRLRAGLSPPPLRIEVDLTTATGTERIFTTHLRQWLMRSLNVDIAAIVPISATREASRAYLEEALCTRPLANADQQPGLVLVIPADALPSLTILFAAPEGRHTPKAGAFVIADRADAAPKWLVSPPEVEPSIFTLQPPGGAFPFSTNLKPSDDARSWQGAYTPAFPLAIRFCDLSDPDPARLITPFALEKKGPLLPQTRLVEDARVSVLYHPSGIPGTPGHLQAFLESLAFQDRVSILELVVLLPEVDHQALSAARELVRRHLGDKARVVPYPSGSGYGARVNEAAASTHGELLLVADGGIILHDQRTLTTLAALAQHERTAAASCMLLQRADRPASTPMRFQSAGYFPVADLRADERQAGQLLAAPHPGRLPPATWPVAATSSKLLMVRADTWRRIGGFGTGVARFDSDVDYGLRSAAQGYFHFSTSVVSASILEDVPVADARAALVAQAAGRSRRIGADEFIAATRAGTLLRNLVT